MRAKSKYKVGCGCRNCSNVSTAAASSVSVFEFCSQVIYIFFFEAIFLTGLPNGKYSRH